MGDDKIKVFTKTINNMKLSLQCIEALSKQAEILFELIANEQEHKIIIQDNYKIQIGWSIYTIKKQDEGFIILAPDYRKNPFQDTITDLTFSILVQMHQNDILKKANIQGQMTSFQDTIVVLRDALNSDLVYMERKEKSSEGDSGWYLGLIKDSNTSRTIEDYKAIYTFQLLQSKPQLLQLLTLPVGCIAIINGTNIEEVVDSQNNILI